MSLFDWKDGEYQYCYDLVRNGGDENVPADCLRSYLELQASDAERDGRPEVGRALRNLIAEGLDGQLRLLARPDL